MDSSIRLAVAPVGFPDVKMTGEQAEEVGVALTKMVNPYRKGEPIQFTEAQYENGCLMVTCANRATESWMHKSVPDIAKSVGAGLVVVTADYMLKGTTFVLWVRTPMTKRSDQQILDLFQKQNRDMNTTNWKIIRRVPRFHKEERINLWADDRKVIRRVPQLARKEKITLWVDDKSFEDLKACSFKLFLGFGCVYLWSDRGWMRGDLKLGSQKPLLRFTNYGADRGKGSDTAEGENSNLTDNSVREVSGTENAGKTPAEKSGNISGEKEMSDVKVAVEKLGEAENFVGVAEVQECEDAVERDEAERKKRKLEEDNKNSETKNSDVKKLKTCHIANTDNFETEVVDRTGAGVPRGKREGEEGTDSMLRLAVVLVGFPVVRMTEEQAEKVGVALVEMLDRYKKGKPIQFTEAQYENGCFMVTCANSATKFWVYRTVPMIGQSVGAKLLVGVAVYMLGAMFVLSVETPLKSRSDKHILDLFQKQNRHITTTEWMIIRRVPKGGKMDRITLWVDDKSFEDLKARSFKLFLGLDLSNLMLWSTSHSIRSKTLAMKSWNEIPDVKVPVEKSGEAENLVGAAGAQECDDAVERGERKKRKRNRKRKPKADNQNPETGNSDLKELKTNQITKTDDSETEEVDRTGAGVSSGKREGEEGTDSSIMLAISPVGFPDVKMTEEQAEVVHVALTKMVNPYRKGEPIQFTESQYENGCLIVTCANSATELWMYKTVPMVSHWVGAKLLVGIADYMLKGTQFVLWVRTPLMRRSNQEILDLFQKQNRDLTTTEWKIIRRVPQFGKDRIYLWVDDKSFEDLKAIRFTLFFGFGQVYLMLWSAYVSKGRGLKLGSQKWPLCFTNYRTSQSVSPKFMSRYFPHSLCQFRGTELSKSTPPHRRVERECRPRSRSLEIADTDPPHFLEARFMATDRPSPPEHSSTKPAVVRNHKPKLSATARPHERGSSSSERSQSRESEDVSSDPEQLREITKCYSQRSQGSDRRQSREVGSKVVDPTHLCEMWHTVSEQLSPRETASNQPSTCDPVVTIPDRAQTRDSSYVIPNRDKSKIVRFRSSDRTLSPDSRLRFLDEPPSLTYRSKSKDETQSREGKFVERDALCTRKSRSRASDPPRLDNTASRTSLSREDRYLVSDGRQRCEVASKSTDLAQLHKPSKATNPPQHSVMDHRTTVPSVLGEMGSEDTDLPQPGVIGFEATDSPYLRDMGYGATDNPNLNVTGYGSAYPPQPGEMGYGATDPPHRSEMGYGATDTPNLNVMVYESAVPPNLNVTGYGSAYAPQPGVMGYGATDPPHLRQMEYGATDTHNLNVTGYGSTYPPNLNVTGYGSTYPPNPSETGYGSAYPPNPSETGYRSACPPNLNGMGYGSTDPSNLNVTGYGAAYPPQPGVMGYGATDTPHLSQMGYGATDTHNLNVTGYGSTYPPNPNVTGYGSAYPPNLSETGYRSACPPNLNVMGYGSTDPSNLNATGYGSAYPTQPGVMEYGVTDPPQQCEMRYTASDRVPSRETGYTTSEKFSAHGPRCKVSDRTPSRDSGYVTPNQDQSKNLRFRGCDRPLSPDSRLRGQEFRLRGSDETRSREDSFVQRDAFSSRESRLRMVDYSELGEFYNKDSHIPRSWEGR